MTKYEAIRKYCKQRGTSVAQLERDLQFARGSIAKIDEHKPSMNKIWKICEYLEMPIQELMDINEEQDKLMSDFDKLIKKPLYRVAAGSGAYNDTHADETIEEDDDGYEEATVIGDSMLPLLRSGDIVKIEPTTETS